MRRKRIELWRLPPVLVVQIKRFHFDRHSRRKLNTRVDFPVSGLDLRPFMAAGAVQGLPEGAAGSLCSAYDLYATVHHVGALGGGHYVAAALDRSGGKAGVWLCFNDETVSEVSEADIQAASAYLLFYVRKDAKEMSHTQIFDDFKRNFDGNRVEEEEGESGALSVRTSAPARGGRRGSRRLGKPEEKGCRVA